MTNPSSWNFERNFTGSFLRRQSSFLLYPTGPSLHLLSSFFPGISSLFLCSPSHFLLLRLLLFHFFFSLSRFTRTFLPSLSPFPPFHSPCPSFPICLVPPFSFYKNHKKDLRGAIGTCICMLPVSQRRSAIFSSLLSLRPTLLLFVCSFVCYLLSLFKICIYSQGGVGVCLLSCENKSSSKAGSWILELLLRKQL